MKIEHLRSPKRNIFTPRMSHFLCLSILVFLIQAISLYHRGRLGNTDVSVFYRTTQLLNDGIGGELYTLRDSKTDWAIAIPPAGLSLFQPLSHLSPATATMLWALFNFSLAAAAIVALRKYFEALEEKRDIHRRILPCATGMFLILASGSLQVGQFSLLFTACWIFALYAAITRSRFLSGCLWALPSAIKVYPLLMLAAPLSEAKSARDAIRLVLLFVAGFALFSLVFPAFFYGERTWELNTSFWENTILHSESRMAEMQTLGTEENQSLDAVLLRYLSYDPAFHSQYPNVPHLNYAAGSVLQFTHLIRLGILLITMGAVSAWRRKGVNPSPYNLLIMAALWSSTLYLILPETRTRYAIYSFLAFIPLLATALAAKIKGNRLIYIVRCATIVVCFTLIMSFIPNSLRVFGWGFVGALILWIENVRLVLASIFQISNRGRDGVKFDNSITSRRCSQSLIMKPGNSDRSLRGTN